MVTERVAPAVPRAEVPRCSACDGPLALTLEPTDLRCAYCGAVTRMDPALRARMLDYVGDVAQLAAREMSARFEAATRERDAGAQRLVVVGVVGGATFLTAAFMAHVLSAAFGHGVPQVYAILILGGWYASLAAIVLAQVVMRELPRADGLLGFGAARCDACGAAVALRSGAATAECPYCRGTLLVPCTLAADLLRRIRASANAAEERLARSSRLSGNDAWLVSLSVGLVTAAVFGGVVLVVAVGHPGGAELSPGVLWALGGGGVVATVLGSLALHRGDAQRSRAELTRCMELARRDAQRALASPDA